MFVSAVAMVIQSAWFCLLEPHRIHSVPPAPVIQLLNTANGRAGEQAIHCTGKCVTTSMMLLSFLEALESKKKNRNRK